MPELLRLRSEIQENMRDRIRKLSGRVFHVVQDRNLLRYRITDSGKVVRDKVRREMRKRVTGDPEKKIRDYMTEVPQVKLIDKVYFTFGVACVVLTEYLALRHPTYFTQYYYMLLSLLVSIRFFQYKEENQELFMLDFCYFANLSTMIQTGVFPDCLIWYKANYVLCMGCLMLAIVVWQNSLVFHSLDKITSFLLHAFPPLTLHMYRWHLIPNDLIPENDTLSWSEAFFWPFILYCVWQVLYIFCTDVLLAGPLQRDPDKITSIRWLVKDKKNGMHQLVVSVCRKNGWMGKDEELDADTWKAKIIFMTSQLVYTLLTMLVVPFLYNNYVLSVVYIASIYMWCVWRGGTYYIEVFSERYKLKFIKDEGLKDSKGDSKSDSEDDVFEDADLFSEIVTALAEETRSVHRESDDSDASVERNSQHSEDKNVEEVFDKGEAETEVNSDDKMSEEIQLEATELTSTQAGADNIQIGSGDLSQTVDKLMSDIQMGGKYSISSLKVSHSSTVTSVTSTSTLTKSAESQVQETTKEVVEESSSVQTTDSTPTDQGSDSSESSYVDIHKQIQEEAVDVKQQQQTAQSETTDESE